MKFLKIIEISIQSQFEYKINYLINFIFSFIPFFTNILLWIAIFNNNENMLDNDKLQSVIDEIRDKYGDKVIGYVSDKDNRR